MGNSRPTGSGTRSALVFQLCQPPFQKDGTLATASSAESIATERSPAHDLQEHPRVPPATHPETPVSVAATLHGTPDGPTVGGLFRSLLWLSLVN